MVRKPTTATLMIQSSEIFIRRTSLLFSKRSEICPATAEKIKNGKIKIPPHIATSCSVFSPSKDTDRNVIRMIRAFLKKLSLNAPRNWVQNRGQNCSRFVIFFTIHYFYHWVGLLCSFVFCNFFFKFYPLQFFLCCLWFS